MKKSRYTESQIIGVLKEVVRPEEVINPMFSRGF